MASKQAGPGCLIMFGLIFIVAGSVPGVIALRDLQSARTMRSWVETPATILHVEMKHGEDTSAVQARYRYRAPDLSVPERGGLKDYEGTQVGIHGGSDNVGDWQAETCARLERAWRTESTVPCWYDPADPNQAVLDRNERWELVGFMLIFPLVFGLAGGGVIWFGLRTRRQQRRLAVDPQVRARQQLITADGGAGCAMWIMAILWNAIAWGVTGAMLSERGVPPLAMLLVLVFPLIGLILLALAVQGTVRRIRHGRPQLRLDDGTWSTGVRCRATVLMRTVPQAGDRIEAALAVVERITTGSGDNESTRDNTLWSLDIDVDVQAGRNEAGQWSCPIEVPLPSDLPPAGGNVSWRLTWQIVRPGPDLSATFTLPVVAGEGGGELKALDLKVAADRAAPLAVLLKAGVRVEDSAGDVRLVLPAWRNPGLHVSGLIATLLLSAGAVALWAAVGWWTGLLSIPIALLCWRGSLRSMLWRSTIVLSRHRVTVVCGWLRMRRYEIRASDITEVERKSSMSSGETAWYNMWLRTADGERIAIVRGVPGPASARIAQMLEAVRS
jgi:hypothetical protein